MPRKSARPDTAAELIAQLMWEPKSAKQLAEAVGTDSATVHRRMNKFRDSGIVYIASYYGGEGTGHSHGRIYAIQSRPFEKQDAERPQTWKT